MTFCESCDGAFCGSFCGSFCDSFCGSFCGAFCGAGACLCGRCDLCDGASSSRGDDVYCGACDACGARDGAPMSMTLTTKTTSRHERYWG